MGRIICGYCHCSWPTTNPDCPNNKTNVPLNHDKRYHIIKEELISTDHWHFDLEEKEENEHN